MKINIKLSSVFLAFVAVFSVISIFTVSAQGTTMTNQQIDLISSNCTMAKNTLNQLHVSDALLRVNMGQKYESMLTKLMTKFNKRLSNNKFDNNSLNYAISSYSSSLDTFRSDYKTYEEHLNKAVNTECEKQSALFYVAVALARTDRIRVHDDIVKMNQYIDQYQLAVNQFEQDYINSVDGLGR